MNRLWIVAICVVLGLCWASSAGPAGDATTGPVDTSALEAQMETTVRQLVAALGSNKYKVREASEKALVELHEKYLDLVIAGQDQKDQEIQHRLKGVLQQIYAQVQMKQAMGGLTPQQRDKLLEFRKAHPALWVKTFSLSLSERIAAVRDIVELEDPKALGEPVLLLSLKHDSDDLVAAAAHAACSGQYRSDAIVDALLDVLTRKGRTRGRIADLVGLRAAPRTEAVRALKQIKSRHATPTIVALLCRKGFDMRRNTDSLASILVALDDKRALPHLVPLIGESEEMMSFHLGGPDGSSVTLGDIYLMTAIRLTGQNPYPYGFTTESSYIGGDRESSFGGFASKAKRDKAIKRFKEWWAANKDKPPYKDLKPLKLPQLPKQQGPWELLEGLIPRGAIPQGVQVRPVP